MVIGFDKIYDFFFQKFISNLFINVLQQQKTKMGSLEYEVR